MFLKLKDMDLKNKRVLIRVDYNAPIKDGKVADDTKLRRTLPTLNYLLKQNCRIILMSHLGRPDKDMKKGASMEEVREKYTMQPVADKLKELLGKNISFVEDYIKNNPPNDEIILLENLRFNKEEKEDDEEFAKQLASFADIYVNDAFGTCHRKHASVHAITKFLPGCIGFLVEKEIEELSKLLNPKKPFIAIIGGAKADKINVIKSLLPKVSSMIIGGVLANTFQKARGIDIKASKFDKESLELAKNLTNEKIILPNEVIAADSFEETAKTKNVNILNIPDNWMIVDIGNKAIETYKEYLKEAKTVVWAGPLGVFEIKNFSKGTKEIAKFISNLKATTIIGGGDSATAINKLHLADKMTHVSTGGGAALEFIEKQGKLPALVALEESSKR